MTNPSSAKAVRSGLVGCGFLLAALLSSCVNLPSLPPLVTPEPTPGLAPSQPDFGMAVISLRNPESNLGLVEVIPVTNDNKLDTSRAQPDYMQKPARALHRSWCSDGPQLCVIPDLAPGRYYLSLFGWTDDRRFDVGAAHAAASGRASGISPDNLFFTVPPAGVVYLGAYDWTGSTTGPDKTFSLAPAPAGADATLALAALLQMEHVRNSYKAWLPMIQQRLTAGQSAASVQSGKPVGISVPWPPAEKTGKHVHRSPENPEDGMAIVVLKNAGWSPNWASALPITFDGRVDRERRTPDYAKENLAARRTASVCYWALQICVLFDLAPGNYALRAFGWESQDGGFFVPRPVTYQLQKIGLQAGLLGTVLSGGADINFVVTAKSPTYVGAYSWEDETGLIGGGKFGITPADVQPGEKLVLQMLLKSESFTYYFVDWAAILRKRLDHIDRKAPTAPATPAATPAPHGTKPRAKTKSKATPHAQ